MKYFIASAFIYLLWVNALAAHDHTEGYRDLNRLQKRLNTLVELSQAGDFSTEGSGVNAKELAYLLSYHAEADRDFQVKVAVACSKITLLSELYFNLMETKQFYGSVGRYIPTAKESFVKRLKKINTLNSLNMPIFLRASIATFSTHKQIEFLNKYTSKFNAKDIVRISFPIAIEATLESFPVKALLFLRGSSDSFGDKVNFSLVSDTLLEYVNSPDPNKKMRYQAKYLMEAFSILGSYCPGLLSSQSNSTQ